MPQKVFIKSLFKSQFPHESVDLSFILTNYRYATGGLGLLGNQPLVILTLLKLIAVEFAPFAWITLTIYAVSALEPV